MRKKLKKSNIILLMFLWMIPAWQVFGQQVQITGKVTDATSKEVLPGVNVIVKGTAQGVSADATGTYNINAASGATLVFSFVGYKSVEVVVGSTLNYDIALEPEFAKL